VKIVRIKVCHFRHGEPKDENIGYYVWKRCEVMLWELPNASLHHEGGEILIPKVAESECINCKHYIK
jgi:hypothetical protein